jgi:ribosomal protein L37AE/L43A
MCIIIAKNKGVNIPSNEIITNCFQSNPDGAGIAYCKAGQTFVTIEKGFLTLEIFQNKLKSLNLGKNDIAIYHFRLATHGQSDAGNCHPFSISRKLSELKRLYLKTSIAVAHNGIFGNMPLSNEYSDTQKFIAFILAAINTDRNLDNSSFLELLKGYCANSSKLIFLTPKKIYTVGNFITDTKTGLLFSNSGYKTFVSYYPKNPEISQFCEICEKEKHSRYNVISNMFLCKKCRKEFNRFYYSDTSKKSNVELLEIDYERKDQTIYEKYINSNA